MANRYVSVDECISSQYEDFERCKHEVNSRSSSKKYEIDQASVKSWLNDNFCRILNRQLWKKKQNSDVMITVVSIMETYEEERQQNIKKWSILSGYYKKSIKECEDDAHSALYNGLSFSEYGKAIFEAIEKWLLAEKCVIEKKGWIVDFLVVEYEDENFIHYRIDAIIIQNK
jgi:hypothetical protein